MMCGSLRRRSGRRRRGENVIREMDRQLKEVDDTLGARMDKKPVVYLVSQMTRYGGPGSMFHELLTRARLENAIEKAGGANGQAISPELIVKADPDMLFVSTDRTSDTTGGGEISGRFSGESGDRSDARGPNTSSCR